MPDPSPSRPLNVFIALLFASALAALELYFLPALSRMLPRCEQLHLLATLCLALAVIVALYWRSALWDSVLPPTLLFFFLFSAVLLFFTAPFFC